MFLDLRYRAETRSKDLYSFLVAAVDNCQKLGGFKQQRFFSLTVLENSEIRVLLAGLAPSGGSEEETLHASLPAPSGCWQSLACLG